MLEGATRRRAARDLDASARRRTRYRFDERGKRALDVVIAACLLLVLLPLFAALAVAIKLDSRGPVFFRARRVGFRGRELRMLKFRKMHETASGPALTSSDDERFTGLGRLLAATKLDELPQLWNVLKGEMSLVGPRPEDDDFVDLHSDAYQRILEIRPGMTGLCQLAFAKEALIPVDGDRTDYYLERLLPQKTGIDLFYVAHRSLAMDLRILLWTAAAVFLRIDVAVHRATGDLTVRRRPRTVLPPLAQSAERA